MYSKVFLILTFFAIALQKENANKNNLNLSKENIVFLDPDNQDELISI